MWYFLYVSRFILFILGLVGFFVSCRYLSESGSLWSYISLGLMVLSCCGVGVLSCRSSKLKSNAYDTRRCLFFILGWQLLVLLSCVLFLVYSHLLEASGGSYGVLEKICLGAWLISGIWGVLLGIGIEVSTSGCGKAFSVQAQDRKYFDISRVKKGVSYYSSISIVLCICICLCYATSKRDKTFDLSYLKVATPSSDTINYLSGHSQIAIEIYFAKDNEVKPYVEKYFSIVSSKVSGISVEYIDLDSSPAKAKERDISKNGFVIFIDKTKDKINKIYINDDISAARKNLRNLDQMVQTHLRELVEQSKTVYLTSSHFEYPVKEEGKDPFKSFKTLSKIFSQINYNVKNITAQDLINGVPEDASCLLVLSHKSSFLPQEITSIDKYLNQGGCLVVFFDSITGVDGKNVAGGKDALSDYLLNKGVAFNKVVLANKMNHVQFFHSDVDNWFLATNSYAREEMLAPLRALRQQVIALILGSGYFKITPSKEGWNHTSLLKTLPATFIDKNLNYKQDKSEQETQDPFDLVVSSTKPVQQKATDSDSSQDSSSSKKESRMVLFPSSSIASDALIENTANKILVLESFRWAFSDDSMFTSTSSEEDVKIQHTKQENILWFNITVFGVPLLVLLIGFVVLRIMRKKQ